MEKPVLLLGATGLLGRNVLNVLLERDIPVRALVRHPLKADGVEQVMGNLLEESDLLRAAEGCRAIINCAGATDMSLPKIEDFRPMNRDLPALLCQVAMHCNIPVLIHVSTANTIASGTREHPATEQDPIGPPYDRSPYALSKLEGERLLLAFASEQDQTRVVILNPGFMVGAWDSKPSSGQLLLAGWRKPLMLGFRGGKSFLHVRDAATAIVNALERGEGRYLLTGTYLSLRGFYALQAQVCGYRQRYVCLPGALVHLVGAVGDLLKMLGIQVSFYSHNLNQLLVEEWYSSERAKRDLNYPETQIEEAITDFFKWNTSNK